MKNTMALKKGMQSTGTSNLVGGQQKNKCKKICRVTLSSSRLMALICLSRV
jgi:hypothetical protein